MMRNIIKYGLEGLAGLIVGYYVKMYKLTKNSILNRYENLLNGGAQQ